MNHYQPYGRTYNNANRGYILDIVISFTYCSLFCVLFLLMKTENKSTILSQTIHHTPCEICIFDVLIQIKGFLKYLLKTHVYESLFIYFYPSFLLACLYSKLVNFLLT